MPAGRKPARRGRTGGAGFRRRHALKLVHARYRVVDGDAFLDVLKGLPFFGRIEREGKDPDEWFEFGVSRSGRGEPEDSDDLLGNFVLGLTPQGRAGGVDVYARSEPRMRELRNLLEVSMGGLIVFLREGPYDGSWPEPWPDAPGASGVGRT